MTNNQEIIVAALEKRLSLVDSTDDLDIDTYTKISENEYYCLGCDKRAIINVAELSFTTCIDSDHEYTKKYSKVELLIKRIITEL